MGSLPAAQSYPSGQSRPGSGSLPTGTSLPAATPANMSGLYSVFLTFPPLVCLDTSVPGTITQAGGVASAWSDPMSVVSATAAGSARPAYSASDAAFNNQPSLTGDGVDDTMALVLDRPAPLTQATFIFAVVRSISHTANDALWGAASNTMVVNQGAASPNLLIRNTAAGTNNGGLAVGTAGAIAAYYDGTTAAYLRIGSGAKATGVDVGNTDPPSPFNIFSRGTAGFWNGTLCLWCLCAGDPTPGEYTAALAYCNTKFGTAT